MSIIEQAELAPQETAPAVIFLPENSRLGQIEDIKIPGRDIRWLSKMTAFANHDLLPDGYACISQVGLTSEGQVVTVERKLDERPAGEERLTLIFDVRRQDQGVYIWELTRSRPDERTSRQLEVTPTSLTGNKYWLDQQGAQRKTSVIDRDGLKQLALDISTLVEHPLTLQRRIMFARQKSRMEDLLYSDQTDGQINNKREQYYKDQKEQERNVRNFGQTALRMYEPKQ